MDHEIKTIPFEVKEINEEEGTFTGHGSAFAGEPDAYGDIVDKGAFIKTIKERLTRIKSLWNHSVMEPIGKPVEMSEDDYGLLVKVKLSLGVQRAREVLSMIKDGVITEMSIGYDVIKEYQKDGVRHLAELRLWDVSPVTFAAKPEALITGVKSELKPYPNEHACRLRNPDDFEDGSFRRMTRVSDGKKYSVIMGRLEGEDTLTEQAYRYDKEIWEAADAKSHCKDHDGKFEAASKKVNVEDVVVTITAKQSKTGRVLSAANLEKVKKGLSALQAGIESLQALVEAVEGEDESGKSTQLSEYVVEQAAKMQDIVSTLKAENEGFDIRGAEERIEAILEKMGK